MLLLLLLPDVSVASTVKVYVPAALGLNLVVVLPAIGRPYPRDGVVLLKSPV
jgi:hypothetical protein